MNTSVSVVNIVPALIRAHAKFPVIVKSKKVEIKGDKGTYSFMYAPLEEIVNKTRQALEEEKLLVMQGVEQDCLVTTLWHDSGEWIAHSMKLPSAFASPRAYGSELTYRRRFSYSMLLSIVAEDDDDGMGAERGGKSKSPLSEMKEDAFAAMSEEEQEFLRKIAADVTALLDEKRDAEAHALLEHQNLELEEKLAIWFLFNSKQRAALKRAQGEAVMIKKGEERASKVTPIGRN